MGHLINPVSTRLGFTSFWVSSWSCFNLDNFSYNLMVDNLVKNFINWAFSENRSSFNLTIVGAFLSHFKIIRRNNSIRIFVFLILDSSKFFRSQSVELDPDVLNLRNSYFKFKRRRSLLLIKNSRKRLHRSFRKKVNNFYNLFYKNNFLIRRQTMKKFISNYSSFILSRLLSKFFSLNRHFSKFNINVDPIFLKTTSFLSANFLSRFLARRLSYGFELNRVLKPLVINLKKLVDSRSSKVVGFRISCRGRFNKAQMASYTWEKYGPVPLNNFSCSVDYSFSKVIMKYGACGIKVWIFTSHPAFRNYRSAFLRKHLNSEFYKFIVSRSVHFKSFLQYFNKNFEVRRFIIVLKLFFVLFDLRIFLRYLRLRLLLVRKLKKIL